jgi:TolB-like protein
VETVAELSDSAVAALNRMLSSPMLAKSPRQRELLNYLARHSFAGQSERLKGYAIGVDVFGRGPDFDPAVDAIVRVEIGRLRSRLREYYEGAGRDDPIRFELPRGRNLLIYRSRDSEAASGGSTQKGDSAAAAVPVLAVLPLTHIGQDASKDYLNDGIVDGLIHELSRLSGMRVISRMSTFTYRGTSKGSREIARELGAGYVLFGSAQYAGERLRLTVQMVHGESDKTIWSERFDADFEAIFSLQDKLAESVVRALQIQLAPAELNAFGHDRTTNIQAHNHFLLGVASFSKGAPNFVIDAKDQFTRAITADPGYAAAHAWLARAKLNLWMMNRSTDAGLRDEALKHAERAVELDPELAYAQSILGWVHLWFKRADEAILHCSRAVAMAPDNPESLNSLSMALSFPATASGVCITSRRP